MDKKTALHILNLNPDVSFEDAKRSYRNSAKKYHPDRVEKEIRHQRKADAKMKEINLAFRYIAPLLRKGYQNYMALKAKMAPGRYNRHQPMSVGRVDKIDPVKPVDPVCKK